MPARTPGCEGRKTLRVDCGSVLSATFDGVAYSSRLRTPATTFTTPPWMISKEIAQLRQGTLAES